MAHSCCASGQKSSAFLSSGFVTPPGSPSSERQVLRKDANAGVQPPAADPQTRWTTGLTHAYLLLDCCFSYDRASFGVAFVAKTPVVSLVSRSLTFKTPVAKDTTSILLEPGVHSQPSIPRGYVRGGNPGGGRVVLS